jgi:multidrug efflux pump subunit AcrA (membrane-fusion protein)
MARPVQLVDSSMTTSLQSQGRVLRFDVTPGEAVKAGQPLLEFSVSESALGSYRQAEIALQTAKVERSPPVSPSSSSSSSRPRIS